MEKYCSKMLPDAKGESCRSNASLFSRILSASFDSSASPKFAIAALSCESAFSFRLFSALAMRSSARFFDSIRRKVASSVERSFSAEAIILEIDSSERFSGGSNFCSDERSEPWRVARAVTAHVSSIENVTVICGTPRPAGGRPLRWKVPIKRFFSAMGLSPIKSLISIAF